MELGSRIRHLRRSQHRTLQEIADACNFSKSLLSKIENDRVSPPVATLIKLADVLGVKVSDLLEDNEHIGAVYTEKNETVNKMIPTNKGYSFYMFAPEFKEKLMQPFLFKAKKGDIKRHTLSHHGHEFVYMLEGEMKYKVGKIEYTLKPGDSIYFDSLEEHTLIPMSDEVTYIAVIADSSLKGKDEAR